MAIDGLSGPPDAGDGPPERGHSAGSADRHVSPQDPPETRSRQSVLRRACFSSGLAEDVANRGIRRFSGTPHGDRLDAVLVIGDNYNVDWRRTG
jgi:hypothetical protein